MLNLTDKTFIDHKRIPMLSNTCPIDKRPRTVRHIIYNIRIWLLVLSELIILSLLNLTLNLQPLIYFHKYETKIGAIAMGA